MTKRSVVAPVAASLLAICMAAVGCGQATPEQTVYKFLGAVQAHDSAAMRSCVNPEALNKAAGAEGEMARQWEELYRRYLVEPVNWRMDFEGVRLESTYLDSSRALVRLAGGRCELLNHKDGAWVTEGEIDFSMHDFVPLYVVMKDGEWYMEALDLYVIYGLESAARV